MILRVVEDVEYLEQVAARLGTASSRDSPGSFEGPLRDSSHEGSIPPPKASTEPGQDQNASPCVAGSTEHASVGTKRT
jgi:hypothetical protein